MFIISIIPVIYGETKYYITVCPSGNWAEIRTLTKNNVFIPPNFLTPEVLFHSEREAISSIKKLFFIKGKGRSPVAKYRTMKGNFKLPKYSTEFYKNEC